MTDYKVKFDVFEGPLDLLLYLIKKEEVDIYDVNLTLLATQFIEYIELMRMLDLEIAGEFLVMASALKSAASLFDLINAVNVVLKRIHQREDLRDIFEDKWSVSEKIEALLKALSEQPALRFSELFASATSRSEVVVTFLALLELIRLKQLIAVQPKDFGEIVISRAAQAAESVRNGTPEPA